MNDITSENLYIYRGTIVDIVDGDTVNIEVDLGFSVKIKERFRLLGSLGGINTPELHDKNPDIRAAANLAKSRVEQLIPIGSSVLIKTEKDKQDGFRRYLAQIKSNLNNKNIGDELLLENLAVVWVKR